MKIKPFVELPLSKAAMNAAKKSGFELTDIRAYNHKNGWISVVVNWNNANCDMKYAVKSGEMFAGYEVAMMVNFPSVKYNFNSKKYRNRTCYEIEIGLQLMKDDEFVDDSGKIDFEPKFFQNLKYGVEVWFAPKKWNDASDYDNPFFKWDKP